LTLPQECYHWGHDEQHDLNGTLAPSSFNLGGGIYRCGLGGATSGSSCDQIVTSGPLFLTGTTLELSTLSVPTGSNSYTIINVTNTGLTLGTFNGLGEGATFLSLNGHQFRIT